MILEKETGAVLGCAMEVSNALGHGLLEKPYENALLVEMDRRGIPVLQQPHYDVMYKGVKVGKYIPDLVVFESLIVDTKTVERIGEHELGQMLNYLSITDLRVGLILNFKHAKLAWKRVVR